MLSDVVLLLISVLLAVLLSIGFSGVDSVRALPPPFLQPYPLQIVLAIIELLRVEKLLWIEDVT